MQVSHTFIEQGVGQARLAPPEQLLEIAIEIGTPIFAIVK